LDKSNHQYFRYKITILSKIVIKVFIITTLQCQAIDAKAVNNATGVRSENLAVVVNLEDDSSIEVGQYYLAARHIPEVNLVKVKVAQGVANLDLVTFSALRKSILSQVKPHIQAIVLIWTTPYAVGCNSITSAITLGYDAKQCENTCAQGKLNPYFDSTSQTPFDNFGLRISMLLPVESVEQAEALIDRGVLSEFKVNEASAYLLNTTDQARSSRAIFFPKSTRVDSKKLEIRTMDANAIEDKHDVMFYFTGLTHVPNLPSLTFMPGAIADHLTSSGGDLLGSSQMSSLRWLEAGATASYGTVSEPCNYWQKFSNPSVLMKHYLSGETAIESYWKSVAWPAQGLFIGEPLAKPY
jgi:uncharacterized protein (TIGR03790 family)